MLTSNKPELKKHLENVRDILETLRQSDTKTHGDREELFQNLVSELKGLYFSANKMERKLVLKGLILNINKIVRKL